MTSRIISGGKSGNVPIKTRYQDSEKRSLTYKMSGGREQIRDLTLLNPPYDLSVLRSITDLSDILNQSIEAYKTNVVGFGMGIRYKVEDLEETEK